MMPFFMAEEISSSEKFIGHLQEEESASTNKSTQVSPVPTGVHDDVPHGEFLVADPSVPGTFLGFRGGPKMHERRPEALLPAPTASVPALVAGGPARPPVLRP
jgi:hypothetical protein